MQEQEEALSWIKSLAAGAALAITIPAVATAAPIVVKSSGPSAAQYQPGKALADNQQIVLKANDTLVLLDSRGTRTLKGPGSFNTTQANSGERTSYAALNQQRRARTGAVRSMPVATVATRSPNIWFVDSGRSSSICLTDPHHVTMWRGDPGRATAVTVTSIADGKSEKVAWAKGQTQAQWPASLPVTSGAQYKVSWPGAGDPTILNFRVLSPSPVGIEDMASALITNGCQAQLDLLIETVALPGDSEGPNG
jgi:hypothetical protein